METARKMKSVTPDSLLTFQSSMTTWHPHYSSLLRHEESLTTNTHWRFWYGFYKNIHIPWSLESPTDPQDSHSTRYTCSKCNQMVMSNHYSLSGFSGGSFFFITCFQNYCFFIISLINTSQIIFGQSYFFFEQFSISVFSKKIKPVN